MTPEVGHWANDIRREGTSGEAVVLIHGFSGHPGHWLPMADVLHARGHTVVAPRLPGHGTSPRDLATVCAEDWLVAAGDAAASVRHHRRVHLVGLSMGGMLAILLARPTAAYTISTINAPVRTKDRKVPLAPLARHFLTETDAAWVPCPDPDLAHLWSPYPTHPLSAVSELVQVVRRGWREARTLRRPALVIQSRNDETVAPVSGPMLARRLDGDLVWLDRCRHNALLDPARHLVHEALIAHVERQTTRVGGALRLPEIAEPSH